MPTLTYYLLRITPAIARFLQTPVVGRGGFQSLSRQLQGSIAFAHGDRFLLLDRDLVQRIYRYVHTYGNGGFERRLGAVLAELESQGIEREEDP